ncbi:hypothetical protein BDV35DRAFT_384258 [Aspergillus flavus]|uniref:Uncharacterized protein n=1 Tax=Aspergillus flavus TaxID=5059 RepID=A0A5N6GK42_ASPFL|nr:hypothetical protein BDV35DRAFT_384258 [Aspergillus flavus]
MIQTRIQTLKNGLGCQKGASRQVNWPTSPPSTGTSEPKRSVRSVCSERLIRVRGFPSALARAVTSVVLPTPGLPSSRIGLESCKPRAILTELAIVVGASRMN